MAEKRFDLLIQENVALAPLTTLKVGGAARFFVSAKTETEVIEASRWAQKEELPLFILGGGSNVLIADRGWNGLVLHIALKGIDAFDSIVNAQAGEDWDDFVGFCVDQDLQGIECLSGIPGTVGGTPVQNVGAYGQDISETIDKVRVYDLPSNRILLLNKAECEFSYRTSIFNSTHKDRFVVLAVTFKLKRGAAPKIVYQELREVFGQRIPGLAETRHAVCRIRAEKAMLVRQGGLDSQSVGSFFKNPIVTNEKFEEMSEKFGAKIPSFKMDNDSVKVPAAWLIEKAGFPKGFTKGNAGLSTRHTLALTNRGHATAKELIALKDEIQTSVKEKFELELKPEPVFIGFAEI